MDQQRGFAGKAAAGDTHGAVDGGDGGGEDPILQRLLHGTPGDPAMESRKETSEGATDTQTPWRDSHTTHDPPGGAKRAFKTQILMRNTARGTTSEQATKPSSWQENPPSF